MAPLSWRQRHHTLLQALLSRGPLPERDFCAVFAAISGKNPATHQQLFNDTLLKINKDLAYLQFELRACVNQHDGMVYYGVVNNIPDEESKLGTKYSARQVAYGILQGAEAVVQEAGNDGSITNIDALNVSRQPACHVCGMVWEHYAYRLPILTEVPFMSCRLLCSQVIVSDGGSQASQSRVSNSITDLKLSQKEKILDELVRDRWLSHTSTGRIGLGIRSFLDLRSWFRGNDISSCVVCSEACIKASSCLNEGCNVRIHEYCLKKKFSQRKASRACPVCGTEWPREEGEVDDANEPGEDGATPANRSSTKRRKRVKAELVEDSHIAGPLAAAVPRRARTLRRVKAEAVVEAAQEVALAGASRVVKARASKGRKRSEWRGLMDDR